MHLVHNLYCCKAYAVDIIIYDSQRPIALPLYTVQGVIIAQGVY